MQTFTLTVGSWLRRLSVRNPLVRTSDRVEALAMFAMLAFTVLAVPVAGAAGTAIYDTRVHMSAVERLTRHEVEATATQDSSVTALPYQSANKTPLQWQFDGYAHRQVVDTLDAMMVGEHMSIWVDAAGDRTMSPLSDNDAVTAAVLAAFGLWLVVAGAGTAAWALLRRKLNRIRYAAWDRELDELADNGGRTNPTS